MANIETVTGGSAADAVTLGSALTTAMRVDLGAGSNRLALAAGGNAGTVSNVATLIGGSGADTISLATAAANASIDLAAGNDTPTLAVSPMSPP